MQYTTNYNLAKPQASDNIETASRTAWNSSMDTIDTTLKTNADNVTSLGTRTTTLEGKVVGVEQKTLLWTNASPTSSFVAQTISLNLSDYDFIEILYRGSTDQNYIKTEKTEIGQNITITYCDFGSQGNTATLFLRVANATNSGIYFTGGSYRSFDGTNVLSSNAVILPYKIYGIKVVS